MIIRATPIQRTVADIRKTDVLIEALLAQAPQMPPLMTKPPPCQVKGVV